MPQTWAGQLAPDGTVLVDLKREWRTRRRPGWERLGLAVTVDGRNAVWLDEPSSVIGLLDP